MVLLDIVPPGVGADASKAERNKFVLGALDGLKKSKPAAFHTPDVAGKIAIETSTMILADCGLRLDHRGGRENLEIKRGLLEKVQMSSAGGVDHYLEYVGAADCEDRRGGCRMTCGEHWFGTHFFNPPRYMRLLEIIPTDESSAEDIAAISHFCDQRLGKAIVPSHDTPNFIANRIGTFSMGNAIRLMQAQGLTIEEVDALTGAPLGWPKTGTFRLGDLVGVDVLAHVASNFAAQAEKIGDERQDVVLAPFVATMLEKKWLGDKAKQGFYKKEGKDKDGRDLRPCAGLADA